MAVIFVSPTERPPIANLGKSSPLTESMGADILIVGKWGMFGVQRKEVKDLVASLRGDRVPKEMAQMRQLNHGAWLIEGKWNWTMQGESLTVPGYTKAEYDGLVFSLQYHGFWVLTTENPADTCDRIVHLEKWLEKDQHQSLLRRPNPPQDSWGQISSREWCLHLLQSFEGISYELATRIYDHFGGLPMAWSCTLADIRSIKGLGKVKSERLWTALGGQL